MPALALSRAGARVVDPSRFTAIGQWIRRASQAGLARLRAPWDPIADSTALPDQPGSMHPDQNDQ